MNILVPTDFSTRSFRALCQAGLLAQVPGQLHVLHVIDDDQPADLVRIETREAERVLREQISSVSELEGVDARVLVVEGDPFDGILRSARGVVADLIVMGAHRRQLLDIFTGTTIERVIRKGTVPVLMVNNEAQRTYEKVVAAVDMSEASANALRAGLSTGLISNEGATLVHAFPALARGKMYIAGADPAAIAKNIDDERRNAFRELRAFLATNNLDEPRWTVRIQEGEAIEVISRIVSDVRADLLIMGTHGRSGLLKTLIGSVTEQALRSLSVDILAVPRRGNP